MKNYSLIDSKPAILYMILRDLSKLDNLEYLMNPTNSLERGSNNTKIFIYS